MQYVNNYILENRISNILRRYILINNGIYIGLYIEKFSKNYIELYTLLHIKTNSNSV